MEHRSNKKQNHVKQNQVEIVQKFKLYLDQMAENLGQGEDVSQMIVPFKQVQNAIEQYIIARWGMLRYSIISNYRIVRERRYIVNCRFGPIYLSQKECDEDSKIYENSRKDEMIEYYREFPLAFNHIQTYNMLPGIIESFNDYFQECFELHWKVSSINLLKDSAVMVRI